MTIGTHLVHNLPDYQLVSDADEEVCDFCLTVFVH